MSWVASHRVAVVAGLLALVGAGAWIVTDGLGDPLIKDEIHFWQTTQDWFVGPFPPSAESLRSYPELVTPFSFVVWGQIERLTGDGVFFGRLLHLLLALAALAAIALPRRSPDPTVAVRAAIGLGLFPYFMAMAVHLYTDLLGALLVVAGLHLHLRGRLVPAAGVFVLAIATRQYLVQIPAALAAWEGMRLLSGEPRLKQVAAPALACASLLGWLVFWGGLAPEPGLDRWIAPYPAPMLSPLDFILEYGLYFAVGLGVYFVLPEAALFGRAPLAGGLSREWVLGVAALLAAAFVVDPPLLPWNHPGGAFGRLARSLLPGEVGAALRLVLFYALALLAVLRFLPRTGLAFWLAAAGFVMSMKHQIPWEKYFLPVLACLWYLRSRPDREGGLNAAREARSRSDRTRCPSEG